MDTDERRGGDGQDGSHRDGLLGVAEVSRPVRPRHDAYRTRGESEPDQLITLYSNASTLEYFMPEV